MSHRVFPKVVDDNTPTRSQGKTRAQHYKTLLFSHKLTQIQQLAILYALVENTKGPTLNAKVIQAFNTPGQVATQASIAAQIQSLLIKHLVIVLGVDANQASEELTTIKRKVLDPINRSINMKKMPKQKWLDALQSAFPDPQPSQQMRP